MRTIHLDKRLSAAAELVRSGGIVADIGTDHGYLPVYLLQTGKILRAVAADINAGPLASAKETVTACGLQERVELRQSDGLKNIDVSDITDIVIAGMGGELICQIIGECPKLQDPAKRLILQPMTHAGTVRRFLYQNGFRILEERAAIDGAYAYCILLAAYTGNPREISLLEEWVGEMPMNLDKDSLEYLRRQQERAEAVADGLSRAQSKEERDKEAVYRELARQIEECVPEQKGRV